MASGLSEYKREAAFARHILRQRRKREETVLDNLFADPVWDMCLDLFAARIEGERVSTSSLVIAAAVPASTALSRIETLVRSGQFLKEPDEADGRRNFIGLSDALFRKLLATIQNIITETERMLSR